MQTTPLACAILALSVAAPVTWAADNPPVAPVRPVTDTYFGTPVVDNYRYMENLKDPQVQQWMKSQADYTHRTLDAIPGRAPLAKQIEALLGGDLTRNAFEQRGQRLFYEIHEPGAVLPKLAWRDGMHGEEHIIVDPAKLSTDPAHHFALDWYSPSWDGRYVAYGISEGGSEKSVLHVFDTSTSQMLGETINRTEDCVVSWRSDNRSFFYLRYPKPGPDTPPSQTLYNAVTFVHTLGANPDGDGDEAVFGHGVTHSADVPEGQGTYVLVTPDSPYAIAVANHNMDNNPNSFYLVRQDQIHGKDTPWQQIATPADGVTEIKLHGDRLYLLSEKDAPHFRIISTEAAHPDLARASVVVPEGPNVIDAFTHTRDALYVSERAGANFQLKRVDLDGQHPTPIALPFSGTIGGLNADPREATLLLGMQGWITAPRELAVHDKDTSATDTGLVPPPTAEPNDLQVTETFATSFDGTRVPVSIIAKKGIKLDRSHPTIVFGYGSYGLSLDPRYNRAWQAWLGHGGVIAVSHMRGGGEYGDTWHRDGQKLKKINTIFDFLGTAQYLIDAGYTQSKYLAANSASAGGIVMGGAMEINPSLFGVVLDDVGLSDALRFETEPNGPPNVPEMGSASTEAGFHGLYAMSAYAHVHDGTPYPAIMFTTGANDPRVSPWHMLKMAARMQAATSSGKPILLRIDYDAGHGMGSSLSQYAARLADEWSFALWQMGEPGFQPKQ